MPEQYKSVFPGNFVHNRSGYGLPNESFKTNNRASGSPLDRTHQATLAFPGWLAVRKIGLVNVGAAASLFDVTIPSPDQRADDKPRADIIGLHIPQGAALFRLGFRIVSRDLQPGASSSGPKSAPSSVSGIVGTATDKLILASATPASAAAGTITATAASTASNGSAIIVAAGGAVPVGPQLQQAVFGSPVVITQAGGLTLRLYVRDTAVAADGTISSAILGGANIIVEASYLVQEGLPDLDDLSLAGAGIRGTVG
jgi:hypothetical protein